jgi:hypothetical protein
VNIPPTLDPDDAAVALCAALRVAGQEATIRLFTHEGKVTALEVFRGSVVFASFPVQPMDLHGSVAAAYLANLQAKAENDGKRPAMRSPSKGDEREAMLDAAIQAASAYLRTGELDAFDLVKRALNIVFADAAPAMSRVLAAKALTQLTVDERRRLAGELNASRCPLCAHQISGYPFEVP